MDAFLSKQIVKYHNYFCFQIDCASDLYFHFEYIIVVIIISAKQENDFLLYICNKISYIFNHVKLNTIFKDPENWDKFLQAKEEDGIKVIRIQSRSIGVIKAKLQVYREFKDVIDTTNILLRHVLDNCSIIPNLSAHKKISSFCNAIEALERSISLCNIPDTLKKSPKLVFTQERLLCVCKDVIVKNIEKEVEFVKSSLQAHGSKESAKKIKDCLEEKIIFEIVDNLCYSIFDELFNHIQSHLVSNKRGSNFDKFNESRSENIRFLVAHALAPITSLVTSASNKAYASSHSSDESTFDVTSKLWREKITNELFLRIQKREKHIISRVGVNFQGLCEKTLEELKILRRELRKAQSGIQLVDQRNCK